MKKLSFLFLLSLLTLVSCLKDHTNESPLTGIAISDVTLNSYDTEKVIEAQSAFTSILAKTIDVATDQPASWLTVKLAKGKITLKLDENTTKTERKAKVILYMGPDRQNISNPDLEVVFYVTHKKHAVFDTFEVHDIQMSSEASADTLFFDSELTRIKTLVVDSATNAAPKWLSVKLKENKVILSATQNVTMSPRMATVTLYYPNNGSTIDDSTIHMTFDVRQDKMDQIILEKKSITVSYKQQTVEMSVTSNVGIQIQGDAINEGRITISGYHIDGTTHKMILNFKENKTESVYKDTLHLVSSTNSAVKADLAVTQKTNPAITLFEGKEEYLSFRKDGGTFQLLINTLTPNYKIVKKASWMSVGNKVRQSLGKYYHTIEVKKFADKGPLRKDTIFVKNDEVTKQFVILQDKYLYLSETEVKLEVGDTHQLEVINLTAKAAAWSSAKSSIVSVSNTGLLTGTGRGNTQVKVTINEFNDVPDYHDLCTVKVYDATDSVLISRNYGNYVKDNDLVTAHCPITILNNYRQTIKLQSVYIVGGIDGSTIISPTSPTIDNNEIKKGGSLVVNFPAMTNVYKPKVVVVFTTPIGKEYRKEKDY